MAKRSGKFYYRNEREVMEMLGMKQVPGSGNGWVAKEDGENEHVLCQLKSTDADSYRLQKLDMDKLILHAMQDHKLPVFAIQFLKSDEVFLVMRPLDAPEVIEYLNTGRYTNDGSNDISELLNASDDTSKLPVVKSSSRSRDRFNEERSKKFKKKERKAR